MTITTHTPPTLNNIPLRFFKANYETVMFEEITQLEFMQLCDSGLSIEYERHTIRENGVKQICLSVIEGE